MYACIGLCASAPTKRTPIGVLGYRQSFRSLRSVKATLSGLETIRTIKRGHIHDKRPGAQGEIALVSQLFEVS